MRKDNRDKRQKRKKGKSKQSVVRKDKGGQLVQRCNRYGCNKRFNVMKASPFDGTKLTPKQVNVIVVRYTSLDSIAPPSIDDLAADAETSRKATKFIVDVLQEKEVQLAKKMNEDGKLAGDVEIDEHGLRSFHVSVNNKAFDQFRSKRLVAQGHKYQL